MKKKRILGLFLFGILFLTACGKDGAKKNYEAGIALLEDGKVEEAISKLETSVKENPEKAEYYIAYGMALIEKKEYDKAQIQFDKAILKKENQIVRENNKQAYRGKGICFFEAKDYVHALEAFDKALAINELSELNLDILYYKGDAQGKTGDYENALKTYNKILDKKKSDGKIYGKRAYIYSLLKDYENAARDYDMAIKVDKNDYNLYFGKYFMMEKLGDEAAAKEVLKQALAIKTKTDEDYFNVGKIHYYQGEYKTAVGELEASAAKGFVEAYYYLGQIQTINQDNSSAIAYYEKYLKSTKDVGSANIYNQLGMCYMGEKEHKKALQAFQSGIALNDAVFMQMLTSNEIAAYEKLADYKNAFKKAQLYVKAYPDDPDMKKELTFIKTRVGGKND